MGQLAAIPGVRDLTLTTNGVLLPAHAAALREAGLHRVTISLDADDDETFMRLNDARVPVAKVLAGIEAAEAVGLGPIKLNMVVKRGWNEHAILPMARRFRGTGRILRFIEYMDVGHSNGWRLDDVVTADEILSVVASEFPLEPMPPTKPGEVAERYRYADGAGEIGVIASVSRPFCGACDRARLSADGQLYTCLFATQGHDLRALVRGGASDEELEAEPAGDLGGPRRPLLGDPLGGDGGAPQGGDELHRRLNAIRPRGSVRAAEHLKRELQQPSRAKPTTRSRFAWCLSTIPGSGSEVGTSRPASVAVIHT